MGFTIGVDSIRPSCSEISVNGHPPGQRLQYTTDSSSLTASWTCWDAAPWGHIPLHCRWAVGSYPTGSDTMRWTPADPSGDHLWNSEDGLENGVTYFVTVQCVDHVGLQSDMHTSGGLMPDLDSPVEVSAPVIVSPSTGAALRWVGAVEELVVVVLWHDFESGIRMIRGAITMDPDPPSLDSMTLELTGRRTTVRTSGLQLGLLQHGGTYWLHVCATDRSNHTSFSSQPWQFQVDLTPPICSPPDDEVAGIAPGPFTARRAGIGASWQCVDLESGVQITRWRPLADDVAIVGNRDLRFATARGRASFAHPMVHAARYRSCVTGRNGAGIEGNTSCSGGFTFDATPPVGGRVSDFGGRSFVNTSSEVCISWTAFSDDVSGIARLTWQLVHSAGDVEVTRTMAAWEDEAAASTAQGTSLCLPVGLIALEHGGRYLSRVTAENRAGLTVDAEGRSFVVDTTGPAGGRVVLRPLLPAGFAEQLGFPSNVSGVRMRVHLAGFSDKESGLAGYDVSVLAGGAQIAAGVAGPGGSTSWTSAELAAALVDGAELEARVVPRNQAGGVGPVVVNRSVLVLAELRLDEPWIVTGMHEDLLDVAEGGGGLPYLRDTRSIVMGAVPATDPMQPHAKMIYSWQLIDHCDEEALSTPGCTPCDDVLSEWWEPLVCAEKPSEWLQSRCANKMWWRDNRHCRLSCFLAGAGYDGDDCCVPPQPPTVRAEGNISAAVLRRGTLGNAFYVSGLGDAPAPGVATCVRLMACTVATVTVPQRCTQATSPPVTMDVSPPRATTSVVSTTPGYDAITRFPISVEIGCDDDTSGFSEGVSNAFLALGTSFAGSELFGPVPLDANLTSFFATNETGFRARAQIGASALASAAGAANGTLVDGTYVYATLTCVDRVGQASAVASSRGVIVDTSQPEGSLSFSSLLWIDEDSVWHGMPTDGTPLVWAFSDSGAGVWSVDLCVGLQPLGCERWSRSVAGTRGSAELPLTPTSEERATLTSIKLYVAATGIDGAGFSTTVATQVVVDWTPPTSGNLTFAPTVVECTPVLESHDMESSSCTPCDDVNSFVVCAEKSRKWLQSRCVNQAAWRDDGRCRLSCFLAGVGYDGDDCCAHPPHASPPPPPPTSPPECSVIATLSDARDLDPPQWCGDLAASQELCESFYLTRNDGTLSRCVYTVRDSGAGMCAGHSERLTCEQAWLSWLPPSPSPPPPPCGGAGPSESPLVFSGRGRDPTSLPMMAIAPVALRFLEPVYDDAVSSPNVSWHVHTLDGSLPPACDFVETVSALEWVATCRIDNDAEVELCFVARPGVGELLGQLQSACVVIDASVPEWDVMALPQLLQEGHRLHLSWRAPQERRTGPCTVAWALCTRVRCDNLTDATGRFGASGNASIPITHNLLANYTGEVWATLVATNVVGLTSAAATTNTVLISWGDAPTPGRLTLGPRDWVPSAAHVVVHIDGFLEPNSGVATFTWCVGTEADSDDILPCQVEQLATPGEYVPRVLHLADFAEQLALPLNSTYPIVVTATACTAASDCTEAVSNRVVADAVDPVVGVVRDGLPTDGLRWDEVHLIACDTAPCAVSPFIGRGDDTAGRHTVLAAVAALRRNESSAQKGTRQLAASWVGFSDQHSGLESVSLCFGSTPGSDDIVPCTLIPSAPSSGVAITAPLPLLSDGVTYYASVRAADGSDRAVLSSSPGVIFYSEAPALVLLEAPSFLPGCQSVGFSWQPSAEARCSEETYSWSLCSERSSSKVCAPQGELAHVGEGAALVDAAVELQRGVPYTVEVTTVGCSPVTTTATSAGFVCDDVPPIVSDTTAPTLRSTFAGGAFGAAASIPGNVSLSWGGVFYDSDTGLQDSFQVCVTAVPVDCADEDFLDVADIAVSSGLARRRGSTSITMPIPADFAGDRLAAVIRARDQAGTTADATTDAVIVDSRPLAPSNIWVETINRLDDEPCVLNRSHSITVRWEVPSAGPDPLLYTLAVRAFDSSPCSVIGTLSDARDLDPPQWCGDLAASQELCESFYVTRNDETLSRCVYTVRDSGARWCLGHSERLTCEWVPPLSWTGSASTRLGSHTMDLSAALGEMNSTNRAQFEIKLTATTVAGVSASSSILCLVQRSTPAIDEIWIADAVVLQPAVQAINPEEVDQMLVCWRRREPSAAASGYMISVSLQGSEQRASAFQIPSSEVESIGSGVACANRTTSDMVAGASYTVQVFAIDRLQQRGEGAQLLLIADGTAPEQRGSLVTAITDSPTVTHQASACCLQAEWGAWVEAESLLTHYSLCFNLTGDECVNVGNQTRVLLERSDCGCAERVLPTSWVRIIYDFPLVNATLTSGRNDTSAVPAGDDAELAGGAGVHVTGHVVNLLSVRFSVRAHNAVGLSTESNPPTEVNIDTSPAVLLGFSPYNVSDADADAFSVVNATRGDGDCGAIGCPIFHPAGYVLGLQWPFTSGAAHFDLCMESPPTYSSCERLAASATRAQLPPLRAGEYNATLTAVSLGGQRSVVSRPLIVDSTAPVMGEVGVDDEEDSLTTPAYWGVGDRVSCRWGGAEDPESGVGGYRVALVRVLPPAAGMPMSERLQILSHQLEPATSTNATLSVSLRHGARYKCRVAALNRAGMASAPRESNDFLADLAEQSQLSLSNVFVSNASGMRAVGLADLGAVLVSLSSPIDAETGGHRFNNWTAPEPEAYSVLPTGLSCAALNWTGVNETCDEEAVLATAPPTRDRLSAIGRFEIALERVVRLNASNVSNATTFGRISTHMDEMDTQGHHQIGSSTTVRFATPNSACCLGPHQPHPTQPRLPHDALLLPDEQPGGFARGIALLDGPTPQLLVASSTRVDLLDLSAPSLTLQRLALAALPYCDNTTEPRVQDLAAFGSAWALVACGALYVFRGDATVPEQAHELQHDAACSGHELGRVALSASVAAAWSGCPASASAGVLMVLVSPPSPPESTPGCTPCDDVHSSLVCAEKSDQWLQSRCANKEWWRDARHCRLSCFLAGAGYGGDDCCVPSPPPTLASTPPEATLRTLSARADACLSCVSASGSLLGVGGSADCSAGGSVSLWQHSSSGEWLERASITPEPQLASTFDKSHIDGCGFGRVLLFTEQLLLVGMPDAFGGAGAVALYDTLEPSAPVLRCQWRAPAGATHFGSTLSLRAPARSKSLLLLAVGRDEGASVLQVHRDDAGAPVCAEALVEVDGGPLAQLRASDEPAPLLLSPSALIVGGATPLGASEAGRGLLVTTLCERDGVRTSSDAFMPLPFICTPCAAHHSSHGGVDHACLPCGETQCVPAHQTTFNATVDASALLWDSGDYLVAVVSAFTFAARGEADSIQRAAEVIVDLTPPGSALRTVVLDATSDAYTPGECRFTNTTATDRYSADALRGANTTAGNPVPRDLEAELAGQGSMQEKRQQVCEANRIDRGADADVMRVTNRINAWWDVFTDDETAVVEYWSCVGSAPAACDVSPMRRMPPGVFESSILLNRTSNHGERFCTSVVAVNAVGLASERVSSDCILVDDTPPVMLFAGAGLEDSVHIETSLMTSSFVGNAIAVDNESDVAYFDWCLRGPGAGGCDLSLALMRTIVPKEGSKTSSRDGTVNVAPERDAEGKVTAVSAAPLLGGGVMVM